VLWQSASEQLWVASADHGSFLDSGGSGGKGGAVGPSEAQSLLATWGPHLVGLLASVLAACLFWLFRDGMIDDSFISFRYAQNIRELGVWGFNPGEVHNTATAAYYTLLLAALGAVLSEPRAALLIAIVSSGVIAGSWGMVFKRLGASSIGGLVVALLLLCHPYWIIALGMESHLQIALLSAAAAAYAVDRFGLSSVCLALAVGVRPDSAPFVLTTLALGLFQRRVRVWHIVLAIGLVGPWLLYSHHVLGSMVPDTFAKKTHVLFRGMAFHKGMFELIRTSPIWFAMTAVLGSVGVLLLVKKRTTASYVVWATALGVAIHSVVYALLRAAAFPWYYCMPLFGASLLAGAGVSLLPELLQRFRPRLASWGHLVAAIACVGLAVLNLPALPIQGRVARDPLGINWAYTQDYATVGDWLKQRAPDGSRLFVEEIGIVGYFSGLHLIDPPGLATSEYDGKEVLKDYEPDYMLLLTKMQAHSSHPNFEHYTLVKSIPNRAEGGDMEVWEKRPAVAE
jgi:hypothetical protein